MTAMIGEAKMHDEPYTNGVKEGDGEYYNLEDYITISMHVCDACGKVYSKTFED